MALYEDNSETFDAAIMMPARTCAFYKDSVIGSDITIYEQSILSEA